MTSLQNGNNNSRSMNGLTSIYANDIVADTIDVIDANVSNNLSIGGTITQTLGSGTNQLKSTNISSLRVTGNTDISGNLNVTGITDTTRLQADNLILGTATYNAAVQLKMNGTMNIGDQVNLNSQSRTLNIRDTNGLISIGRYSSNAPGFELRNYNPTGGALRQDVLFLGPSFAESWSWLFRTPGAGGDYTGGFFTRAYSALYTPLIVERALTGTAYISRFIDATADNRLDVYLNPTASMYNSLVQAGDIAMIGLGSVNATRNITIGTQNSTGTGIRLTSTSGITVGGNTTFTANSNIIQSGTGIIDQSTATGINLMEAITLNTDNDLTFQGTGKVTQPATSGINAMSAITLSSTTTSTNTTSGALIVGGGAGIAENVNIGGTLSIPSYPNVKTTLDTIIASSTTNITGITYNAGTDTTTIDNNVIIGNNKNLFMDGANGYISQGLFTGAVNYMSNISMNNQTVITHQDGTSQRSIFTDDILNDTEIHSLMSGRTILYSTYNLGNATNHVNTVIGTGVHFCVAVQLVKGQVYSGIGIYTGTVGNYNVALYNSGFNGLRFAYSISTASVANSMNYIGFLIPYQAVNTQIAYAIFRTTSGSQTSLYLPANPFLNLNLPNPANGTLNRRSIQYANANDFSTLTAIPAGQAMTNQTLLQYLVLY